MGNFNFFLAIIYVNLAIITTIISISLIFLGIILHGYIKKEKEDYIKKHFSNKLKNDEF